MSENNNISSQIYDYVLAKTPHIAILTPCYGGLCSVHFTKCLVRTFLLCKKYGIGIEFLECAGDSLVSRARNNLIARAMSIEGFTHLMFIDGDIEWEPMDIIKLLLKDKDLVGGSYPHKSIDFNLVTTELHNIPQWIENKNNSNIEQIKNTNDRDIILNKLLQYNINYLSDVTPVQNNLISVKHIATGFLLMKRSTIEKMMKHYPETKYIDDVGYLNGDENNYAFALFDCQVKNKRYLSEDWLFCERWADIGGECFIDITINLNHIGTMVFNGSLLNKLLV